MRIFVPVLLLALMLPAIAGAGETRDPYKYFFNDTFGNFSDELQTAKKEGKDGVLVFFEMAECPFCHYMKSNVLNRPNVQTYYRQHFLNFPVDIEGDILITDFHGKQLSQKDFAFKENRVRATPVIAFYDLQGNEVFRYTGRTADMQEFLQIGRYVAEGAYKQMSFTKYKREQRK